jgi:hypothetical protein
MDPAKIMTIEDCEELRIVHEVRSFLGLANYYSGFVGGYSKISSPLSDLLEKNKAWNMMDKCHATFCELKHTLVSTPLLKRENFDCSFEVQMDTSDFSIHGVLSQKGHLISYERRKIQDSEQRYP